MADQAIELARLEGKIDGLTSATDELRETMAALVKFMHQNEDLRKQHGELAVRVQAAEKQIERWKGAIGVLLVIQSILIGILAAVL
jgi:hypothetical protein